MSLHISICGEVELCHVNDEEAWQGPSRLTDCIDETGATMESETVLSAYRIKKSGCGLHG